MSTFILPTIAWSSLLPIIVQDAQPGDVIEIHTAAMEARAWQAVQDAGRDDLHIVLLPPDRGAARRRRSPTPLRPDPQGEHTLAWGQGTAAFCTTSTLIY